LNTPLNILQVCLSLDIGGAERVLLDLVKLGPRHGFSNQVALISARGGLAEEAEAAGASVHLLGKKPGFRPFAAWRLANLARSLGCGLFHAHNIGPGLYAGLASLLSGRPSINTRHGSLGPGHYGASRVAGRLNKATVCVGQNVLERCRDLDGLNPAKMSLIYNGVDFAQLRRSAGPRRQTRSSLGIAEDDQLLISVGRLSPEKNFKLLLEAMARLEGPKLILVGEGPERPALEESVRTLGLGRRVFLLGARHDVASLLAASDAFVMSSDTEGVSKALLEAMVLELPAVATSVGGTPEVLLEGITGLLTPKGDGEALAAALARVLDDTGMARAMGEAASARAKAEFGIEACVSKYYRLYRQVLKLD
jgi:glycosyltransferase involved in cell wall biosynthesis